MVENSGGTRGGKRFLLRIRMPDQAGSLARVAGRIGAVRGDLVGIDILERADGWVVDELLVELPDDVLPDEGLLDLLVRELSEEGDVVVEEVVDVGLLDVDAEAATYEVVSVLLGAERTDDLLWSLCTHLRRTIRADWACVVERGGLITADSGAVPADEELASVIVSSPETGQPMIEADSVAGDHLCWVALPGMTAMLVVGRRSSPLRAAERRRVAALARVAGAWHGGLRGRARFRSMMTHPSAGVPPMVMPRVPDDLSALVD